jgi:hypothetical protein
VGRSRPGTMQKTPRRKQRSCILFSTKSFLLFILYIFYSHDASSVKRSLLRERCAAVRIPCVSNDGLLIFQEVDPRDTSRFARKSEISMSAVRPPTCQASIASLRRIVIAVDRGCRSGGRCLGVVALQRCICGQTWAICRRDCFATYLRREALAPSEADKHSLGTTRRESTLYALW